MPIDPAPSPVVATPFDLARRAFHASLTPAQSHGFSWWDSIADALYRGGEDESDDRFRKKVRRAKPEAPQDGSPL